MSWRCLLSVSTRGGVGGVNREEGMGERGGCGGLSPTLRLLCSVLGGNDLLTSCL